MVAGVEIGDDVSVIIPTLALASRRHLLRRALQSIWSQTEVVCRPIVVVNGASFDADTVHELETDPRIDLQIQPTADLPRALALGRRRVATSWFASLDDDDELLPYALASRLRRARESPASNVVVSNGYRRYADHDELAIPQMSRVVRAPLSTLTEGNWLLPGSWLCRADEHSRALFDEMPRYLECTYLAIRFCLDFRVSFQDQPTVIWNGDTPESLSKSREYVLGQPEALRRLLQLKLPAVLSQRLRRLLSGAEHDAAELRFSEGQRRLAWQHHLRSVVEKDGWRFLPYTRKAIARSLHAKAGDR